ncbi:MAG: SEFIR domain-containing protein [Anaerolineales bacterium]
MSPKVFISYSWSSPTHQLLVQQWAEQLVADGIDVVLDIYDLKEGQDKYAFMERMVTDESVTHVLIICDQKYAEKADARKAGVGTESQIISKEVYEKVEQSKFIPIVCEFDESENPFLPIYLKSRIWIDFSTPDAVNKNWERLIRVIYGKPLHEKPKLGKPPVYITTDVATPTSHIQAKFNSLKQAILQGRSGLSLYRRDFLDACIEYADELRIRERPDIPSLGEKILEDATKLKLVRNHIVDWVLLEGSITSSDEFSESLISFLERLRELKSRPPELNSWNDAWFEAHSVFIYETFLYIIASLIKTQSFEVLNEIFTTNYLRPSSDRHGDRAFETFNAFYGHSDALQSVLAPQGKKLFSPAAEFIHRNADRADLPFKSILEAELLVLLMSFLNPDARWYPQTFYYAGYGDCVFPLFLRATQHKYFIKFAVITGIKDANELRERVKNGYEQRGVSQWYNFDFQDFWGMMNLDKLDTLK